MSKYTPMTTSYADVFAYCCAVRRRDRSRRSDGAQMLRRPQTQGAHSLQENVASETVFVHSGHGERIQHHLQCESPQRSANGGHFPGELKAFESEVSEKSHDETNRITVG